MYEHDYGDGGRVPAAFRTLQGDEALTQPVAITRNGRERVLMISVDEYRRLNRRSREVLRAGELSDADLTAIAKSEMDPRHAHFDKELE